MVLMLLKPFIYIRVQALMWFQKLDRIMRHDVRENDVALVFEEGRKTLALFKPFSQ